MAYEDDLIKAALKDAIDARKLLVSQLKESETAIAKLVQARMCDHKWKDTGSFMYATVECSKCHFSFMDS